MLSIPRADLAAILLDASRDNAEFLWGDTLTGLIQHTDGVDVTFEYAEPRRFDFVIGADGLHSAVRRLTFGEESEFVRHIGIYIATIRIDEPFGSDREVLICNTPGRALSVHPTKGRAQCPSVEDAAIGHAQHAKHQGVGIEKSVTGTGFRRRVTPRGRGHGRYTREKDSVT